MYSAIRKVKLSVTAPSEHSQGLQKFEKKGLVSRAGLTFGSFLEMRSLHSKVGLVVPMKTTLSEMSTEVRNGAMA